MKEKRQHEKRLQFLSAQIQKINSDLKAQKETHEKFDELKEKARKELIEHLANFDKIHDGQKEKLEDAIFVNESNLNLFSEEFKKVEAELIVINTSLSANENAEKPAEEKPEEKLKEEVAPISS